MNLAPFGVGHRRGWQVPASKLALLCHHLIVKGRQPWELELLGLPEPTPWTHNDIMFDAATILGQLATTGLSNYRAAGMYFEFKNVASPGDTVTPPVFGRGDGVSYYNGLAGNPNTDYLRVPMTAANLTSSDEASYPGGNIQNYFALSQGTQGVHGLPFSDAHNSVVYGGAVVSFVDATDASQDLVLSRYYMPTDSQLPKLPTGQVGLQHKVQFG